LLGLDPAVLAQHPQRPDHGRPGDLELVTELMLTGQQRARRVLAGLDPPPQLVNDLRVLRRGVLVWHESALLKLPGHTSSLLLSHPGCHPLSMSAATARARDRHLPGLAAARDGPLSPDDLDRPGRMVGIPAPPAA